MKYQNCVPVISTDNVRASMDYYANVLGFEKLFLYGDPLAYGGMQRDGVHASAPGSSNRLPTDPGTRAST